MNGWLVTVQESEIFVVFVVHESDQIKAVKAVENYWKVKATVTAFQKVPDFYFKQHFIHHGEMRILNPS